MGYGDGGYGEGGYGIDILSMDWPSRTRFLDAVQRWVIGPWNGEVANELTTATNRTINLRLEEPSEINYTDDATALTVMALQDLVTDGYVWRNGEALFRGRVLSTTDELPESFTPTVGVRATDYRGVLERRILSANKVYTATTTVENIVWDLISDAQGVVGGDMGITKGVWEATGYSPTITFTQGTPIWEAITTLRGLTAFDFDINASLVANLYSPERTQINNVVLDYGGMVVSARRTFDSSKFANFIRQSGADGVASATASGDFSVAGRWDAQFSDTNITSSAGTASGAIRHLEQASRMVPTYELTLGANKWDGLSHIGLGDYVTVRVQAGRLDETHLARVYEIIVSVDNDDKETVTLVTGDPRVNGRTLMKKILRQIAKTSRR